MRSGTTRHGSTLTRWASWGAALVVAAALFSSRALAETTEPPPDGSVEETAEADFGAGESALLEEMAAYFGVSTEEIKALRAQDLGIGEILILYSLASWEDEVQPDQVAAILELRQDGLGWGEIAAQLGVHPRALGHVVAEVLRGPKAGPQPARWQEQEQLREPERLRVGVRIQEMSPAGKQLGIHGSHKGDDGSQGSSRRRK